MFEKNQRFDVCLCVLYEERKRRWATVGNYSPFLFAVMRFLLSLRREVWVLDLQECTRIEFWGGSW